MDAPPKVQAVPLVSLRDVSYVYPSDASLRKVVSKVEFSVQAGEVVRLSGRNGSGKTTLLKLLAGEFSPTEGQRTERAGGVKVVYLDQNTSVFLGETLTIREQLAISAADKIGLLRSCYGPSVEGALKTMLTDYGIGLENRLDQFVADLSGGERQVVALLSVILCRPNLLLLDEFTASLDAQSSRVSANLVLKAVRTEDTAAVCVNHSALEGAFPCRLYQL